MDVFRIKFSSLRERIHRDSRQGFFRHMHNYINGVCGPRPARGAARRSASAQWPAGEDVEISRKTKSLSSCGRGLGAFL